MRPVFEKDLMVYISQNNKTGVIQRKEEEAKASIP
jgi:hypothetical protein